MPNTEANVNIYEYEAETIEVNIENADEIEHSASLNVINALSDLGYSVPVGTDIRFNNGEHIEKSFPYSEQPAYPKYYPRKYILERVNEKEVEETQLDPGNEVAGPGDNVE